MKRADVVIAGVVVFGVFGLVLAGQMASQAKFSVQSGGNVVVGACTVGNVSINGNTTACYFSGIDYYEGQRTLPCGAVIADGCSSRSIVHCPSQKALWPEGAEGSSISTKLQCGGSYYPRLTPNTVENYWTCTKEVGGVTHKDTYRKRYRASWNEYIADKKEAAEQAA